MDSLNLRTDSFDSYQEAPVFKENPFSRDMANNIKVHTKKIFYNENRVDGVESTQMADMATGEVDGNVTVSKVFSRIVKKDGESFVKLYIDNLNMLFDLSLTGRKVLQYVLQALQINKDKIFVNPKKGAEACGYKQTVSYYQGMTELLKKEIIALSEDKGIVYINPRYMFNGDRMFVVKEIINKDYDQAKAIENPAKYSIRENQDWPDNDNENNKN